MELAEKLKLVPSLVEDWKKSAARGGARTTLTLAKAHYPELNLNLITSGILETYDDGVPVDKTTIRRVCWVRSAMCERHSAEHILRGLRSARFSKRRICSYLRGCRDY
jgi:hypothetical protein